LVGDYLSAIVQIVEFASEPQFINNFANFDKKLHKNVIKRCAIEPLEVLTKAAKINYLKQDKIQS
jgi:hypothetical protein